MTLAYETVRNWEFAEIRQSYTVKDTLLYALGIGFGMNPTNADELKFVYEKDLAVMPTQAVILGYPGMWMKDPATGIDVRKLLHAEQRLRVCSNLPAAGEVISRHRVKSVTDKGAGKGALVVVERVLSDAASGRVLAIVENTTFCRGDGGYSAGGQPSDELVAPSYDPPDRAPDDAASLPTRPEMALIYRLSGDFNPLHADPSAASIAGFERPILHGLATYALAARAVVARRCGGDASRLKELNARFTAPVYPGETVLTEMWVDGDSVSYRCSVPERQVAVLRGNAVCSAAS